jgi:hypothetical protein
MAAYAAIAIHNDFRKFRSCGAVATSSPMRVRCQFESATPVLTILDSIGTAQVSNFLSL